MGISQQIGSSSLSKPGVCTSSTRPATPYEGQMIYETDTDKVLVWNGTAWVIPNIPEIAVFQEQQNSGTSGGNLNAGAWTKRTLNTTVTNGITGCSIASSVITLTAGTYKISSGVPAYNTNGFGTRLRNTTAGTSIVRGTALLADDRYQTNIYAQLQGIFTLTGSTTIELQYYASNNYNSNSGGVAFAQGDGNEIYANILIERIAF